MTPAGSNIVRKNRPTQYYRAVGYGTTAMHQCKSRFNSCVPTAR